jgi:outer membrane protein
MILDGRWMTLARVSLMIGVVFSLASCTLFKPTVPDTTLGPAEAGQAETPFPSPEPSATKVPPQSPTIPPTGPVTLDVNEAILLALENNEGIKVDRYNPEIVATTIDTERAAFDPTVTAAVSVGKSKTEPINDNKISAPGPIGPPPKRPDDVFQDTKTGSVAVTEFLPTGTTVAVTGSATDTDTSNTPGAGAARVGLTVTQSLLQGLGVDVNLASLRQARIDTRSSEFEFRGYSESVAAQVEDTYWDYIRVQRNIEIFENSLKLAEQQLGETKERIRLGKLAETEMASAEAEVALRQEDLIVARANLAKTRLQLLRLINPPGADLWLREITLKDQTAMGEVVLQDVEAHAAFAMDMRPDLNQARLAIQRGELQVVKTKNGLLPILNAFVNLGKSGYASSLSGAAGNIPGGDSYDWTVGLNFQYPIGNRGPDAVNRRALATLNQAKLALSNLSQLAQVDVRSAYLDVTTAKDLIVATAATRKKQEVTATAEIEKFRVGRSTSLLVAQAQRDLLQSQITEVAAIVGYRQALVALFRLEGSLLLRRGIRAPGEEPVKSIVYQPES